MKPKMPETKLERINDHLYHETSGNSKIKWEKNPELLDAINSYSWIMCTN